MCKAPIIRRISALSMPADITSTAADNSGHVDTAGDKVSERADDVQVKRIKPTQSSASMEFHLRFGVGLTVLPKSVVNRREQLNGSDWFGEVRIHASG